MVTIDGLIDYLVEAGSPGDRFAGCTSAEIEAIRLDQGVPLVPRDYARFLEMVGREAGLLLRGTDAFYPEILGIKRDAQELLEGGGSGLRLEPESLVIAMHQGYQVFWFQSVREDAPRVLMHQEGSSGIMREWGSFVDYLISVHAPFLRLRGR